MNRITSRPLDQIGYGFIPDPYLPRGRSEYYLRDELHQPSGPYRKLRGDEIEILVHNNNTSNDWSEILVSHAFDPSLVKRCQFYGRVRIGKLEPLYLEFHDLRLPVGLYDSTICSCDIGDNVVIMHVGDMSHYIIGDHSILVNVQELTTTNNAKFGNGILKEGETEAVRIWLEICNENGGRKVLPFDGMWPADAWIWSSYRDRKKLLERFKEFTGKVMDARRGYYGTIGRNTVIKNCRIIKDVRIGDHAYLKGANKLKNMTINSTLDAPSQIGEGVEMVNGIMDVGCRAFYGIKAVRFVMASFSNLKYGARLINSYLGNNATISCCEVLNSLIFPAHEQHHNTSFLIASTLLGQSNVAAGATIGSNHNSRGADGELLAGRGFWPGLSVTLKHNCRFASFTLITKGNYRYEIDLKIPFSIVSNDESKDELVIYPGYWFDHNLFALARNTHKFRSRDLRLPPCPPLEYEYLAPDSVGEMLAAIEYLESRRGEAKEDILVTDIENAKRKTRIRKPARVIELFGELICYYLIKTLTEYRALGFDDLPAPRKYQWLNLGGQLITREQVDSLLRNIETGKIKSWEEVHQSYLEFGREYVRCKLQDALACFLGLSGRKKLAPDQIGTLLPKALKTNNWIYRQILRSKQKDFNNPFRKMMYRNQEEMDAVLGTLDDIPFLKDARDENKKTARNIKRLRGWMVSGG